MLYALKIASRYLTASKAQTALLAVGVALGVFIFIFMSALIGGLAEYIMQRTAGDISHVTIAADAVDPALVTPLRGTTLLVQAPSNQKASLNDALNFLAMIEAMPEVKATSPQISGAGIVRRGTHSAQISIIGLETGRESAILNLDKYVVQGTASLRSGAVLLGQALATDLGLTLGQTVQIQSSDGIDAALTLTGIYLIGSGGPDRRMAYVSLTTARTLFAMPQGVSQIEIKLFDLYAADAVTARIKTLTGLPAKSWTEDGAQLLEALKAQAQTGYFLKGFAMISIIIGVASALLLSTYRRRPEIGIMRAMGASRRFVVVVFVMQGALVGVLGAVLGAVLGYAALLPFPSRDNFHAGTLPMDITQGSYGLAIVLTVLGAILASILPARAAARVDPVTAIGQ
jgi:lipoprotein-releasing system permease protein